MPKTRKYSTVDEEKILKVSLSLATKEDVLEWSHGEVTKPETINYKSYKPERHGLFDELIFGPATDYKCPICGKKYKKSNEGLTCNNTPQCEIEKPEILPKISRRSRMGHIALQTPVVHFWFFKIDNSIISKLLVLRVGESNEYVSKNDLENIIYYKSHIVLDNGGLKSLPKNKIININNAAQIYKDALIELRELNLNDADALEIIDGTINHLNDIVGSKVGNDYGVDFYELNEVIEEYSSAKIQTGSKAIEFLLENIDLEEEQRKIKSKIKEINNLEKTSSSRKQDLSKLYKRLQVVESFINSGQKPTSMLIYNLPVIPAELRPLVQLDGGRHSTSDINELYRRIIIRNNRLRKWIELNAPTLITQNELRMIQEAVDALIDNSKKKPKPVTSKDNRNLKSISDALTGKKGRFRQNLLGKRVDYSGRSVIVVGPELKMNQVGIPREMAAKLFEPWIIKELIDQEITLSVKSARKLIDNLNPIIWPHVAKVIQGRPVLLNRAPTLHRLSIQAFEPVLIRGKAIKLHPLVTTAFNADFDGDQMAVHVPISDEAVREAKELLFANRNILGPKDGEPIINPSQDMILGIYYLTIEIAGAKGEAKVFQDVNSMLRAYEEGSVSLHARVAIPFKKLQKTFNLKGDKGYIFSTVGKFIFNQAFPENFPFIFDSSVSSISDAQEYTKKYYIPYGLNIKETIQNTPINDALSKKDLSKIIRTIFDKYVPVLTKEDVASVINDVNHTNYKDTSTKFANLVTTNKTALEYIHAESLSKFTTKHFVDVNKKLSLKTPGNPNQPIWEVDQYVELLENVWFDYVNIVASVLDEIKDLGFKFSTKSGTSISIHDIEVSDNKKERIKEGDDYTSELKSMYREGLLTDDERYSLTINKWSEVKDNIQNDLKKIVKNNPLNPIFIMMNSGARSNMANYVQLAGIRGLMTNNTKILKSDAENERVVRSTVEIPVKSSFLDGLTAYEFYSSTHGARKGLTDTALNTAKSGYLTRRLVDVAQGIVVTEKDCATQNGFVVKDIVDNKTKTVIVPIRERIEGRFTIEDVKDKDGNVIVEKDTLIDAKMAEEIVEVHDVKEVNIRSILGCEAKNGVCQKCFGKDLATSRIVSIGEAVGITASQSIGEPGTQLTMRTFHSGGVAGVEDITGGFGRLTELIDAYRSPWGRPAIISKVDGIITEIKTPKDKNTNLVYITYLDQDDASQTEVVSVPKNRTLRVKVGDKIVKGQKIIDGPIILEELLEYGGPRKVQSYLLKEIQKIYRMQGIAINDKYIEIIISQMLSKIEISEPGDSDFIIGSLVNNLDFYNTNNELLEKGLEPAKGKVVIHGAKRIPLLSNSFLAAASYQESAKILVNSSISSQQDFLVGVKENIILGKKIPAGTNSQYESKSKFDIRDPKEYFKDKSPQRHYKIEMDNEVSDMFNEFRISQNK
ncbi:DNA-DIRECTED RNA POLYMERASE BETA' CHAIN (TRANSCRIPTASE BETA' CHAIN) (RNA POLYMERASE BETA' SUBUNIT) [Mycoplasmopsis pulmonis]|uniref:DNA-directed RNA polymerase subunit beta' n=1 Tax=Mycoplasmopsis pulmonis (strain UAB CTIP) TaxID=272635 RepID=RPOC_MYCPU|nr:DNA-directed RNA polymerase subunit beta' [Mycoplasmopsis pulmonis]Q98Q24.1 RecName: Full=DNA-directed RNA polymerase subunit beta'; Short=RNAP subunit beta'; AltName: Full=RNA polymerase subunit beta'; AltName: Full=Transcriptase subunit beta' [Mycoplasmopsis pulmonis UAB CTIP]CAC13718.1 DNA-DIRECTED RNA POLYMERASE BETA' CHAIN (TRANSCRIPTASE BETA' CHAIN) (RNA POLYMERASE BETA' SUBUNIT) [Mycoplasmopsis pulmonis]